VTLLISRAHEGAFVTTTPIRGYDVWPDGRRFLVTNRVEVPPETPAELVLVRELARRAQGTSATGDVECPLGPGKIGDGTCYRPPQAEATMTIPRTLTRFVCVAFACASVMLQAQANQGRGQAQGQAGRAAGQGGQPQGRGQASDEANRGKVEQVKAGQEGFVTIFDGTSMKGWSVSGKSRHSNGVKFLDWTDTMPRLSDGYLALQVHGGTEWVNGPAFRSADSSRDGDTDYTKRYVRYRNVRIKTLR
jgi:hypothetical protein